MTVMTQIVLDLGEREQIELAEMADSRGQSIADMLVDVARRLLSEDTAFRTAVVHAIAQADDGQLAAHEDIVTRAKARRV